MQLKLDEYGYELEDIDVDGKDINKVKVKEKSSNEGKTKNAQSSNDEEDKQVFNEESNGKSKTDMKESLVDILDISIENIEID